MQLRTESEGVLEERDNGNGTNNGNGSNNSNSNHESEEEEEVAAGAVMEVGDLRFQKVMVNDEVIWLLEERSLRKDIDHCLTCGSFALKQEFFKAHYCTESCYYSSPQWLEEQQQLNAPIKLFKQPALPSISNPFRYGQFLEAIDPENRSLFCVVSVVDVRGWRLKLRFEGYSDHFDFWVNCDSLDIFPVGWCAKNGHYLQPPGEYGDGEFSWDDYLDTKKGYEAAPPENFQITKEQDKLDVDILGMKLEAVDIRASNLIICVATVTKVMGHRFLVHFDSWDNIYDYWADLSSPFVFPIGHCERTKIKLTPPNGYENFSWEQYLTETKATPMPTHLFQPLPPVGFKRGMRIECVDVKNPRLIRPAVIHATDGHMVTVRYEGWPEAYDARMNELCDDLHPVGFCETTGHPLERVLKQSKNVCPNMCEWKGNVVDPSCLSHCTKMECPYLMQKERVERVVVLVPPGTSGGPLDRPHVLPGPMIQLMVHPNPEFCPGLPLPSAFLKQSMTVGPPAPKKPRKEDIQAKMMSLAQSVLTEERGPAFLLEKELGDLTEETVRTWNVQQTFEFVTSLPGCANLAAQLKDQLVDGDSLLMLTKDDFRDVCSSSTVHWMKVFYALHVIRSRNKRKYPKEGSPREVLKLDGAGDGSM